MRKNLRTLTKSELKKVKILALAKKHDCSEVYVRCVLNGSRAANSELAKMILKDALDIIQIMDRDTMKVI